MARPHPSDPFDFPLSIIPRGLSYQWCAKELMGEPHPQYKTMVDGGWLPVPAKRHPGVFRKTDADGNVAFGGQVLMCRLIEVTHEAKERNDDKAHLQAHATARQVSVVVDLQIRLSRAEMDAAVASGISCHQYAVRRISRIEEGRDRGTVLRGPVDIHYPDDYLEFSRERRPKHKWLRGLFNLISTEH
jgi:hypothetical protein